jgi:hypothetical protein
VIPSAQHDTAGDKFGGFIFNRKYMGHGVAGYCGVSLNMSDAHKLERLIITFA